MIAKKRILPILVAVLMVFALMPMSAKPVHAEDDGAPAIALGAGNIEKGNKVYMGVRKIDDSIVPISWLVLGDANSSDLKNSANAAVSPDNARLLITEKTQGGEYFDPNGQNNTWQGSNIQNWCTDTFLNDSDWNGSRYQDHFTESEKSTMLYTSKTDDEYNEWGTSELKNEKLFLLSAEEVSDEYEYGYFLDDESRIAYQHDNDGTDNDGTFYWWLRSPYSNGSLRAALVTPIGDVEDSSVDESYGARPAFNFNLTSVLFTSAAAGGKSSGACGADALKEISDNTTNEWKLTLKDYDRTTFEANATAGAVLEADEGYSDWTVPVTYSEAKTGENEYVSVILTDSKDKALYYGNIAKNSAASSGSGQDVAIPEGLAAGSYTMYVFNEQINGDKRTDYASEFHAIELKVNSYPPGGQTTPMSIRDAKVVLSESSYVYNGKVQRPAIVTIGGQTLTAGTDYTAVWSNASSKDAGTYTVTITGKGSCEGTTASTYTISKAVNPLAVKGKKVRVNYKKLVKRTRKLNAGKTMTFIRKGKGRMKYKLTSAKKGKKSFLKNFRINARTGRIAIKKGLKKGTYKVKVKVKANGNANYKASAVKTVTFKVKVK